MSNGGGEALVLALACPSGNSGFGAEELGGEEEAEGGR